jgi:signal transduction histidine kinase
MLDELRNASYARPMAAVACAAAATVALFSGSLFVSLRAVHAVGAGSADIAANAVPSVVHLSSARTRVRHLEVLADDVVDRGWSTASAGERRSLADQLAGVTAEVSASLSLPSTPAARDAWGPIRESLGALQHAHDDLAALPAQGADAAADRLLAERLKPSADALDQALGSAMMASARFASDLADEIQGSRRRAVSLALSLGTASLLLSTALVAGALKMVRRHSEVLRRNAELEAARASELDLFAGRVAHDIRGPLNVVHMGLALATRTETPPGVRPVLDRATRSLRRAVEIVEGLYEFAGAAHPPHDASADVARVLGGAVEDIEEAAREARVEVRLDAPPVGAVACRSGVLASIASNLLHNALKFMGDGPVRVVRVAASDGGRFVRLEFEDSGRGIAAAAQEQIFEAYARGGARSEPGLGLGLATVRRLVSAHGGRVWVESEEGHGARFVVELPKAGEDRAEGA